MSLAQVSAAALSVLNLSYYGEPRRDPHRNLKYKTICLIQADRCFDALIEQLPLVVKGESQ